MQLPKVETMLVASSLLVWACDSGSSVERDDRGGRAGANAKPGTSAAAATTAESEAASRPLKDTDFVESEQNRDPFRDFLSDLKGKGPIAAQRTVLMPNTAINAMKLIAIISGIDQPRAMLVDERGVGYVTTRGDFVGKAEVVQTGSGENLPVTLNWRIDRIRENEVVLAREDPSGPNRPPLTRVIPLHDESEEGQQDEVSVSRPGNPG